MNLRGLLPIGFVKWRYVNAGADFGDAVSYDFLGECVGFDKLFKRWAGWEREYARRGYRTISLDAFIGFGGYGEPIDNLVGVKREEGEEPIYHADHYGSQTVSSVPLLDICGIVNDRRPQEITFVDDSN